MTLGLQRRVILRTQHPRWRFPPPILDNYAAIIGAGSTLIQNPNNYRRCAICVVPRVAFPSRYWQIVMGTICHAAYPIITGRMESATSVSGCMLCDEDWRI